MVSFTAMCHEGQIATVLLVVSAVAMLVRRGAAESYCAAASRCQDSARQKHLLNGLRGQELLCQVRG